MAQFTTQPMAAEKTSPAGLDVANRVFFRLYQSSNLMHKIGTRFMSEFGATPSNGPFSAPWHALPPDPA